MKLFDVTIVIQVSCYDNISYIEHTISTYANSKAEAVKKVKENTTFRHFRTDNVEEIFNYETH